MKSLSPNFLESKTLPLEDIESLTGGGETTLHTHIQAALLSLAAGEDLVVGDPVYVSTNLFYKADNVTNIKVVGIVTVAALTGFLATAAISGKITLSGLTAATPYFLGNLAITSSVPVSGNIIRLGTSISTTGFILNIEEPILLA